MISFVVEGLPVPQGSMYPAGKGKVIHSKKKRKDGTRAETVPHWRARAARVAAAESHSAPKVTYKYTVKIGRTKYSRTRPVNYDCAVIGFARFYFPLKNGVKPGDPKITAPDTDKLQRALGDALETAGVVSVDSRISDWCVSKRYDDHPRVEVTVMSLTEYESNYERRTA